MKKKDILELKKRFKKNECTITRVSGCYVDGYKNQIVKFNQNFLNLEDEEFYKYLEIAKKALSGTIGNNLLQLPFPEAEEHVGGRQQFFMGLKSSALKNEDLLDRFYELVIDTYQYVGNYLILLFHDAYDVMTKTSDNNKLDESEEVYEYLLCAICPVDLTKPGLGYLEEENRIGVRMRDWVVGVPETGFLFPAFSDRSSDIHSLAYYTKNPKDPHKEFMEGGLGCVIKKTVTEKKEKFHSIIKSTLGVTDEKSDDVIMEIQESLNEMIEEHDVIYDKNRDPIVLTGDKLQNVMKESGIPTELTSKIEQAIAEEFEDELPTAEDLVDTKALTVHAKKKKEKELVEQVKNLKQQLATVSKQSKEDPNDLETMTMQETVAIEDDDTNNLVDEVDTEDIENLQSDNGQDDDFMQADNMVPLATELPKIPPASQYDVVVHVKPQKVSQITSQVIDGHKCLVIPLDQNEQANINGMNTTL